MCIELLLDCVVKGIPHCMEAIGNASCSCDLDCRICDIRESCGLCQSSESMNCCGCFDFSEQATLLSSSERMGFPGGEYGATAAVGEDGITQGESLTCCGKTCNYVCNNCCLAFCVPPSRREEPQRQTMP